MICAIYMYRTMLCVLINQHATAEVSEFGGRRSTTISTAPLIFTLREHGGGCAVAASWRSCGWRGACAGAGRGGGCAAATGVEADGRGPAQVRERGVPAGTLPSTVWTTPLRRPGVTWCSAWREAARSSVQHRHLLGAPVGTAVDGANLPSAVVLWWCCWGRLV
jgi:hypothetical protein